MKNFLGDVGIDVLAEHAAATISQLTVSGAGALSQTAFAERAIAAILGGASEQQLSWLQAGIRAGSRTASPILKEAVERGLRKKGVSRENIERVRDAIDDFIETVGAAGADALTPGNIHEIAARVGQRAASHSAGSTTHSSTTHHAAAAAPGVPMTTTNWAAVQIAAANPTAKKRLATLYEVLRQAKVTDPDPASGREEFQPARATYKAVLKALEREKDLIDILNDTTVSDEVAIANFIVAAQASRGKTDLPEEFLDMVDGAFSGKEKAEIVKALKTLGRVVKQVSLGLVWAWVGTVSILALAALFCFVGGVYLFVAAFDFEAQQLNPVTLIEGTVLLLGLAVLIHMIGGMYNIVAGWANMGAEPAIQIKNYIIKLVPDPGGE